MIKLQVIGNVGQDARINEVNGRKSINFSVAHNRKYKNSEGVEVETTTWVGCSYWKNPEQSTEVAKYLTSGAKVYVEGIPTVGTYKNKEGVTVPVLNLAVTMVQLLSVKEKEEGETPDEKGQEQAGQIYGQDT